MANPESLLSSEGHLSPETPSVRDVYRHLFPGNHLDLLPFVSPLRLLDVHSIPFMLLADYIESIGVAEYVRNTIHRHRERAFRWDMKHPDRASMILFLRNLSPIPATIHGPYFNEHSFTDLVDVRKGERIGGAAVRFATPSRFPSLAKLSGEEQVAPHQNRREIVMGILGKSGRSKGLVFFVEGPEPRKPESAKPHKRQRGGLLA